MPPHSRHSFFRRLCGHFFRTAGIVRYGLSTCVTMVSADDLSPCLCTELHTSCARRLSLTVVMETRGRRGGWGDAKSKSPRRASRHPTLLLTVSSSGMHNVLAHIS
jgi:hypothetical protein